MSDTTSMSRRRALGLIGGAVAAPAFIRRAHAAEVTLRLHHFLPPTSNMHRLFFEPWAKELSEQTDGALAIELFPSMQLGGEPAELVDYARKGIADITWTLPVSTPGRFPIAETMALPFMVTSAEKTSVAMHQLMDEFAAREYREVVIPLAFHVHAGGKLHMREKPIVSAADLEGVRIHAPSQAMGEMFTAMQADPVFLPVTELAAGLTDGVIDGTCLPYEIVPALKLQGLTKYSCEPAAGTRGLYANPFALVMNIFKHEELPDDIRKVFDAQIGPALSQRLGKAFDEYEKIGSKLVREHGNEIVEIPGDEIARWRETAVPVHESWARMLDRSGHDGDAVLARLNALLDDNG